MTALSFPFKNPGRIPQLLTSELSELCLFAIPAATFLPAGLLSLAQTKRSPSASQTQGAVAWMIGLWMLGYLIVTFCVYDRAMGSYFIPVYPLHAITAAAACIRLRLATGRWILALAFATAPLALPDPAAGCAALLLPPRRSRMRARVAAGSRSAPTRKISSVEGDDLRTRRSQFYSTNHYFYWKMYALKRK